MTQHVRRRSMCVLYVSVDLQTHLIVVHAAVPVFVYFFHHLSGQLNGPPAWHHLQGRAQNLENSGMA